VLLLKGRKAKWNSAFRYQNKQRNTLSTELQNRCSTAELNRLRH
jgi:hypothetical protein